MYLLRYYICRGILFVDVLKKTLYFEWLFMSSGYLHIQLNAISPLQYAHLERLSLLWVMNYVDRALLIVHPSTEVP